MNRDEFLQGHHDFHVQAIRERWLNGPDDQDFQLAKFREAKGEVKSLSMDCKTAEQLLEQYFLVSLPSVNDLLLRLRASVLQDVFVSHIMPTGGNACLWCADRFLQLAKQHSGE